MNLAEPYWHGKQARYLEQRLHAALADGQLMTIEYLQ
jgi:hypothetical protein